jgi:uncharacterized membrane protein
MSQEDRDRSSKYIFVGIFLFLSILIIFFFSYQTYALVTKDRSLGDQLTGIAFISAIIISALTSLVILPEIDKRKDRKKLQVPQVPQ